MWRLPQTAEPSSSGALTLTNARLYDDNRLTNVTKLALAQE